MLTATAVECLLMRSRVSSSLHTVDGTMFGQLGTQVEVGRQRPADEETRGGTSPPSQEGEKKE